MCRGRRPDGPAAESGAKDRKASWTKESEGRTRISMATFSEKGAGFVQQGRASLGMLASFVKVVFVESQSYRRVGVVVEFLFTLPFLRFLRLRAIAPTSVAYHWKIVCCSACHPFPADTGGRSRLGDKAARRQRAQASSAALGDVRTEWDLGEDRTSFKSGVCRNARAAQIFG